MASQGKVGERQHAGYFIPFGDTRKVGSVCETGTLIAKYVHHANAGFLGPLYLLPGQQWYHPSDSCHTVNLCHVQYYHELQWKMVKGFQDAIY